jgi:MFS transporter, FHS family, glucose/mannose:H+ symporter
MDPVISAQLRRSSAGNLRALTVLVSSGFVLTGVVNTFLGPILPALAAHWHLSDSQSGYFFAAQFLGSILGVAISSFLLPRRGYRFSIGLSYLLMAAGVWGLALAQWQLALLGPFIFGVGFGVAIPGSNLLISALNQHRRASALSILNFCWGLGAVLAPFGLALAARWNHVGYFLPVLSGLLLITLIGMAATAEGSSPHEEAEPDGRDLEISRAPSVVTVGAMFFLYVAVEASIGGWIATLAERAQFGAGQAWIVAPAVFWAGLLTGRGITPLLLRRTSERHLTLIGLVVACLGILVLVLSHHRQWITLTGAAIGGGLSAVFPITVTFLSYFKEREKRIAGFMFGLAALGGVVMPWFVGAISTWSGSLHVGVLAPMLCALALLCLHTMWSQ